MTVGVGDGSKRRSHANPKNTTFTGKVKIYFNINFIFSTTVCLVLKLKIKHINHGVLPPPPPTATPPARLPNPRLGRPPPPHYNDNSRPSPLLHRQIPPSSPQARHTSRRACQILSIANRQNQGGQWGIHHRKSMGGPSSSLECEE